MQNPPAQDTIKWTSSWTYQPQLHVGCRAIEKHFDEPCGHAIVQGWQKGYEAYGRLNSNLVYGYQGPNGEVQRKYKYNWDRFVVNDPWKWVQTFSDEEWSMHFPQTLPISVNQHIVDDFCQSVAWKERALFNTRKQIRQFPKDTEWLLNYWYPQSFNQCEPSFGERCPFLEACHNPTVGKDPLNSSFYIRRQPHHKMEVEHGC